MGDTWVVSVWHPPLGGTGYYGEFDEAYRGESFLAAMWAAWKAKRHSQYVKVDWR